jgi:hypothetical protein
MKTLWLLSILVLLEWVGLTTSAQAAQPQVDGSASPNQSRNGDTVIADAREDFEDWLERERRAIDDDNDDRRDRRDRRDRQEAREERERRRNRGDRNDRREDRLSRDRDDDNDDDDGRRDRNRIRIGRDRDNRDRNDRNGDRPLCQDPNRDHQGWRWILEDLGGCR